MFGSAPPSGGFNGGAGGANNNPSFGSSFGTPAPPPQPPSAAAASSGFSFGQPAAPPATTTPGFGSSSFAFGQSQQQTPQQLSSGGGGNGGGFGAAPFGSTPAPAASGFGSAPATFGTQTGSSNTPAPFGSSGFGGQQQQQSQHQQSQQHQAQPTFPVFGVSSNTTNAPFGASNTTTSMFGASSNASSATTPAAPAAATSSGFSFGSSANAMGSASTQQTPSAKPTPFGGGGFGTWGAAAAAVSAQQQQQQQQQQSAPAVPAPAPVFGSGSSTFATSATTLLHSNTSSSHTGGGGGGGMADAGMDEDTNTHTMTTTNETQPSHNKDKTWTRSSTSTSTSTTTTTTNTEAEKNAEELAKLKEKKRALEEKLRQKRRLAEEQQKSKQSSSSNASASASPFATANTSASSSSSTAAHTKPNKTDSNKSNSSSGSTNNNNTNSPNRDRTRSNSSSTALYNFSPPTSPIPTTQQQNNNNNNNSRPNSPMVLPSAAKASSTHTKALLPPDLQARASSRDEKESLFPAFDKEDPTTSGGSSSSTPTRGNTSKDAAAEEATTTTTPRKLHKAKALIGACTTMCPDEELLQREKEGDIQLLEMPHLQVHVIPPWYGRHGKQGQGQGQGQGKATTWTLRETAVKRFRRSAADYRLDIPSLVRPPEVLELCLGYLEEWIMERDRQGPDPRFQSTLPPPSLDVYQFMWDRTRMIRKDFTLQNYTGTGAQCSAIAVRCHERMARWHAMMEHQLSHLEEFVSHQSQQNIQELGQTMKTLNQFYEDALGRCTVEGRNGGGGGNGYMHGCFADVVMGPTPKDYNGRPLSNTDAHAALSLRIVGVAPQRLATRYQPRTCGTAEPEMRGLYILLTMHNDGGMEVLKYAAKLCVDRSKVYWSKPVQLALTIFRVRQQRNYAKFFKLLRAESTPYLYACIMFKYVEEMRKYAFRIMSRTFGAKRKDDGRAMYDAYPLKNLVRLLCFEDLDEALAACRHYGIMVQLPDGAGDASSSGGGGGGSDLEMMDGSSGSGKKSNANSGLEGATVLWRHKEFREPRDPQKGNVLPLRPRKMMRTIEAKLGGATRLAVCRGQVSGEGSSMAEPAVQPVSTNLAETLKEEEEQEEEERRREETTRSLSPTSAAQQEAALKKKLQEEREKRKQAKQQEEEAAKQKKAQEEAATAERLKQKMLERQRQLEDLKLKQAQALAEAKRKQEEEQERQRQLAQAKAEQERKEQEAARAKAKAEEEERLRRLEEERRLELERQKESARLEAEKKRREEEERERQRRIALEEKERERQRQEEEARRRKQQEEEEQRRRQQEAEKERLRKLEEEIRRQQEEERQRRLQAEREAAEARRREQALRMALVRKTLVFRLWRKTVCERRSSVTTRRSIAEIDPTFVGNGAWRDAVIAASAESGDDKLASEAPIASRRLVTQQFFSRLAMEAACKDSTGIKLASMVRRHIMSPATKHSGFVLLWKLGVVLPQSTDSNSSSWVSKMNEAVANWIDSRLKFDHIVTSQAQELEIRVVSVHCSTSKAAVEGCDAVLFVLPPYHQEGCLQVEFLPEILGRISFDTPRMVMVLDDSSIDETNSNDEEWTVRLTSTALGRDISDNVDGQDGVAKVMVHPSFRNQVDAALTCSCEALLTASFATEMDEGHVSCSYYPPVERTTFASLGRRCIREVLWTKWTVRNAEGYFLLRVISSCLERLLEEVSLLSKEMRGHALALWPGQEFSEDGRMIPSYFVNTNTPAASASTANNDDLPINWQDSFSVERAKIGLYCVFGDCNIDDDAQEVANAKLEMVLRRWLDNAPGHVVHECEMLLSRGFHRRCIENVLVWQEEEEEKQSVIGGEKSYVYFPRGKGVELSARAASKTLDVIVDIMSPGLRVVKYHGEQVEFDDASLLRQDELEELTEKVDVEEDDILQERTPLTQDVRPNDGTGLSSVAPTDFDEEEMTIHSKRPLEERFDEEHATNKFTSQHSDSSRLTKRYRLQSTAAYEKDCRKKFLDEIESSKSFTSQLEALLRGEATVDLTVGVTNLSSLVTTMENDANVLLPGPDVREMQ